MSSTPLMYYICIITLTPYLMAEVERRSSPGGASDVTEYPSPEELVVAKDPVTKAK